MTAPATTRPGDGTPLTTTEMARIDTKSDAYLRMERRWNLAYALMDDSEALRTPDYMPMLEAETPEEYEARVKIGAVFNGFERTVLASVGMLGVHDPMQSQDTPAKLKELADDVDGAGTALAVFASRLAQKVVLLGHAGIFVDMAQIGEEGMTDAQAQAQGIRPYWILVSAEDEWLPYFEVVGGRMQLTMLIRRVRRSVRKGAFGVVPRTEFWLYALVKGGVEYSCYATEQHGNAPMLDPAYVAGPKLIKNLTRIPYARVVANGETWDVETKPTLNTLAELNVEHHQIKNGIESLLTLAFTPTQVVIGMPKDKDGKYPQIIRGPRSVIHVPYQQGVSQPVYWDSPDTSVLEPAEVRLKATELAMEVMGSAFLASQTRAAETAEAKKINAKAQHATLGRVGRAIADGLTNAMSISAELLGLGTNGGAVTISTDFEDRTMDPQTMSAYVNAVASVGFPVRVLLKMWQEGGRIAPDANLEELEREMLADAEAKRAADAIDAALAAEQRQADAANQHQDPPADHAA